MIAACTSNNGVEFLEKQKRTVVTEKSNHILKPSRICSSQQFFNQSFQLADITDFATVVGNNPQDQVIKLMEEI